MNDTSVDVGQSEVSATVSVGESFVVEAELVKNGGVEIVNVNRIFRDAEPQFVGLSVDGAASNSCTCHPDGETVDVMIPPVLLHLFRPGLNR